MDDEPASFMRHWWANAQQALLPNKWLGIYCWQQPCDVWTIQEIIGDTRPDAIIETGTFAGAARSCGRPYCNFGAAVTSTRSTSKRGRSWSTIRPLEPMRSLNTSHS